MNADIIPLRLSRLLKNTRHNAVSCIQAHASARSSNERQLPEISSSSHQKHSFGNSKTWPDIVRTEQKQECVMFRSGGGSAVVKYFLFSHI